jgi:hypothetical protein
MFHQPKPSGQSGGRGLEGRVIGSVRFMFMFRFRFRFRYRKTGTARSVSFSAIYCGNC